VSAALSAATSASSAAIVPAWQITVQIGVGLGVNQAGLSIREMPRLGLLDTRLLRAGRRGGARPV
jgi:hypothetical protein